MKAEAVVRLAFPSEKNLQVTLAALKPEAFKPATMRSKETLKKEGRFLVLEVEAADTVALRVALNAYLRWLGSIASVLQVLETHC